jgi:hypothetical protein
MAIGTGYITIGVDTPLRLHDDIGLILLVQFCVAINANINPFGLRVGDRGWQGWGSRSRDGFSREVTTQTIFMVDQGVRYLRRTGTCSSFPSRPMAVLANIIGPPGMIIRNFWRLKFAFLMTTQAVVAILQGVGNRRGSIGLRRRGGDSSFTGRLMAVLAHIICPVGMVIWNLR